MSTAPSGILGSACNKTHPGISTAPPSRTNSPSSVITTTTATSTCHARASIQTVVTSPTPSPPSSRPSTPPVSAQTTPNTSSANAKPADKPLTRWKWFTHLSHISIATWIGVGLALAGLVVAVYYGTLMLRLAFWQAKNDFRETCKSELEAALSQTSACYQTLAQQPQPPPIHKRMILAVKVQSSWDLAPLVVVTFCVSPLLVLAAVKTLERCRGKSWTRSKSPVEPGDPVTTDTQITISSSPHNSVDGDMLTADPFETTRCPPSIREKLPESSRHSEIETKPTGQLEQQGSNQDTEASFVQIHSVQETAGLAPTQVKIAQSSTPKDNCTMIHGITLNTHGKSAGAATLTEKDKDTLAVRLPSTRGTTMVDQQGEDVSTSNLGSFEESKTMLEDTAYRYKKSGVQRLLRSESDDHDWRALKKIPATCKMLFATLASLPGATKLMVDKTSRRGLYRMYLRGVIVLAGEALLDFLESFFSVYKLSSPESCSDGNSHDLRGGFKMPDPSFEMNDTVSMSVRVRSRQMRKNFVVVACRRSDEGTESIWKWEYQLRDADGVLHAGGAWFQEGRDGLCQTG